MSAYAISAANLDIVEKSLQNLAQNLGGVNTHVGEVSNHLFEVEDNVKTVTNNVKSLEEEIKAFMLEIRESSVVSNARQTILLDQAELEKKYGHYDEVRRKISGILQSADIKAVNKATLMNISENTIVSSPNYFLAPCLVAICAWYLNDKALADRAVSEALKRDDEKTSLLFSLIHLRAGRYDTAVRWLNRYLTMQDPSKMEPKIINVIDTITSLNYGNDAINLFIEEMDKWVSELKSVPNYSEELVSRWTKFFEGFKVQLEGKHFPYLEKFCVDIKEVKDVCSIAMAKEKVYSNLENIINSTDSKTNQNVDNLLSNLVSNYDSEELDLKKDIMKNKLIIEENGNTKTALDKFEESKYVFSEYNNFYMHLTNASIDYKNIVCSNNARKFSLSVCKNFVLNGYNNFSKYNNDNDLPLIDIDIDGFHATTKTGNNQKELDNSLRDYYYNINHDNIYREKYFGIRNAISIVIAALLLFFTYKITFAVIGIILMLIIFNAVEVYRVYSNRKVKVAVVESAIKQSTDILDNILAEVVDYYMFYKQSLEIDKKFKSLVENLDYKNYIVRK